MKYIIILLVISMVLIAGCGSEVETQPEQTQDEIKQTSSGLAEQDLLDDNLDEGLDELDQLES